MSKNPINYEVSILTTKGEFFHEDVFSHHIVGDCHVIVRQDKTILYYPTCNVIRLIKELADKSNPEEEILFVEEN